MLDIPEFEQTLPKMRVRLSRWLIVTALVFSLGFHWVLLQSVAWVGMVISYSHQSSLVQALQQTFDGDHPCKLCRLVAKGKAAEQRHASGLEVKKLDPALPPVLSLLLPTQYSLLHWRFEAFTRMPREVSPPDPPPRMAT